MRKLAMLLIVVLMGLWMASTVQADVITVKTSDTGGMDSWIEHFSSRDIANYGTQTSMNFRYSTGGTIEARPIMYFPVSTYLPAGATVTNATLEAYQISTVSSSFEAVTISRLTADWMEYQVTFNDRNYGPDGINNNADDVIALCNC